MPDDEKFYVEFRFKNGLVLSGFTDEHTYDHLFRNNAAPSQLADPAAPIFGRNLAVLLQDLSVAKYSTTLTAEAAAFHRLGAS